MKICCVVGARPQFVKAAALSRAVQSRNDTIFFVHTGQHYDANMSEIFFEEMEIPRPDHQMQVGGLSQGAMTGRMMEQLERVFLDENPDCVTVFGDTNSTLAGALTATKMHIPVAHIEAGLRSYNKRMPEEINRVLTDHCSDLLFVPTNASKENLMREGIDEKKIFVVGDIMVDALYYYKEKALKTSKILEKLGVKEKQYVLATVHRAESTEDSKKLRVIFESLIEISKSIKVIIPLHPRTRAALKATNLLDICEKHLEIISPVGYFDMLVLEQGASVIMTDSGGIQKEAYLFQVPCITMRNETEWRELVDKKYNTLVSPVDDNIVRAYHDCSYPKNWDLSIYGEGNTSQKILDVLLL
ncbi:MAG: UDP-N-acetylglucosamine 2-epimerase (non-hydrolyzing) [Chlamydiota bacterium]|nr:UDP-N-acetylglucosamine 2-epimerase (non-hydrolyzing) [Chlamydiota bacterium]